VLIAVVEFVIDCAQTLVPSQGCESPLSLDAWRLPHERANEPPTRTEGVKARVAGALASVPSLLASLALLVLPPAHAADRPSAIISYVNDYARLLSPAEVRALEQHLVEVSRDGRYEIAVALYPRAPTEASAVESTMLADRLMVGSSLGDRGIVLLAFVAERIVRVEIGYGLEGLLPDVDAHRAAELAAAQFARARYADGIAQALAYLEPRAAQAAGQRPQARTSWDWLPDWMLMVRDVTRGYAFYARNRAELPRQIAGWWRAQDPESQSVITALVVAGAVFVLVCLRPALGALLGVLLPPPWMRNAVVRWTFFRFTGAWYERAWKSEASPPVLPRWAYVFDLLYYAFGALVLPGLALAGFIMMIGHPGAFGGAGGLAQW